MTTGRDPDREGRPAGRGGGVLAFSGGIGGAKLALGLDRVLAPGALTVVANTGDDFEHLGLSISPDIDTLLYTLAGIANPELGWGRRDETWSFMETLAGLGGEDWFRLGDRDLALHVMRTSRLKRGDTLAAVTADAARSLGVARTILPMSDDPVRTRLATAEGWLDFQDYFVRRRSAPAISAIAFAGADVARPSAAMMAALADPALRAIVICPSNPLISIEPILSLPGVRDALARAPAPVVAVSPIVAGRAVKGPTAKMMAELGEAVGSTAVARRYRGLIDALIVDAADGEAVDGHGAEVVRAATLMTSLDDRIALAGHVLAVADRIAAAGPRGRQAA